MLVILGVRISEGQGVLPEDRLSLSNHVVCQRRAGINERGGLELSSQWVPGVPEVRQGSLRWSLTRGRLYRAKLILKVTSPYLC